MKRYLLSLDFDFFPTIHSARWDWQHAETRLFRELLWPGRAAGLMLTENVDDPALVTRPTVTMDEAVNALTDVGVDLRGAALTVSDSHCRAMPAFSPLVREDADWHILHFDAHHDLGYSLAKIRQHEEECTVDAEDWLLWLLAGSYATCDVIYPAWRGLEDWEALTAGHEGADGMAPWYRNASLPFRVSATVWPELPGDGNGNDTLEEGQVAAIHFCRSGSWSPPWHDEDYLRAVGVLERVTGSKAEPRWLAEEGCDVLAPRPFDLKSAREEAQLLRNLHHGIGERRQARSERGGEP